MIELVTKLCEFSECRKVMRREQYPGARDFRIARFCSSACNHRARSSCDWQAIMEFEVIEGVELTCEAIGKIGHVSRHACEQVVDKALAKLAKEPYLQQLAHEWKCAR